MKKEMSTPSCHHSTATSDRTESGKQADMKNCHSMKHSATLQEQAILREGLPIAGVEAVELLPEQAIPFPNLTHFDPPYHPPESASRI